MMIERTKHTAEPPPVVSARRVSRRFGNTVALDGVDLDVHSGQAHALVGRNGAGKSTLVSILTGLARPDAGSVSFAGEAAPPLSNSDAWRQRVACVYQHSTVIPALSVAENLYLNRQSDGGRINWKRLRTRAAELLGGWGVDVDPARPASDLTIDERQLVEIARALSFGARFIILDEPTAQLDGSAITRLFARLRELGRQGVTFLYISHHLQEIYELCQTVTVLRDARHIVTAPVASLPQPELVAAMTGDATGIMAAGAARTASGGASPLLDVRGLSAAEYRDVSLTVGAGEVVGVAGGGASGKVALGETLVGLRTPSAGEVRVRGRRVRPGDVRAALDAGVGFVPQDRHHQGLVPRLSVAENSTMTVIRQLGRFGWISARRRDERAGELIGRLDIKTAGPAQPVSDLSGGNQQKVVLARALASRPGVLVLLSPTAGVDVRAKESLLATIDEAARAGTGVLVVSDDLTDLRPCDRVVVMFHGEVTAEMARGWSDVALVSAMEGVGHESASNESASNESASNESASNENSGVAK